MNERIALILCRHFYSNQQRIKDIQGCKTFDQHGNCQKKKAKAIDQIYKTDF